MNEQEWLEAKAPGPMIREFLAGKVWDRKSRLFETTCCRRVWDLLTDERSRQLLEVAEKFADGDATDEDLGDATDSAQDAQTEAVESGLGFGSSHAPWVVLLLNIGNPEELAWEVAARLAITADGESAALHQAEQQSQVRLLRDILGNPFSPVTLDSTWLAPTVTTLAQAIYDDRVMPSGLFYNQRLGVLADALEEAGCDNADILDHLRSGGEHVCGCWVVDLVLGRK